jgi:hypothetical protein
VYEIITERVTSVMTYEPVGPTDRGGESVQDSRVTVTDFEARIRRYNSDLEHDCVAFRAAVILLAGLEFGHNIDRIARRTGYDRPFVARVARRLTDNGVWKGGVTVADWSSSDEASGTFWNDVAVAEGKMCRRIAADGQIEWAPAGFWNKDFHYVASDTGKDLSTQYFDPSQDVDNSARGDVDKSAGNDDDAFLIGDDADADVPGSLMVGAPDDRPEVVETHIIGPLPGATIPLPSSRVTVPPLDDLFRDVVWIG